MPAKPNFPYLRAYARYMEFSPEHLDALLATATALQAPIDTYACAADGRWLTMSQLDTLGGRGSIVASHTRRKILEYAGETPPADPSPELLKRLRAL